MISAIARGHRLRARARGGRSARSEPRIATVGAVPASLPPLAAPDLSLDAIRKTLPIAFAVTLLALTEAVSIARAIARQVRAAHRRQPGIHRAGPVQHRRQLLLRLRVERLVQPQRRQLRAGARTPLAAVFSAALLLALSRRRSRSLGAYLPLAVMAAILFLVAWGLFDLHHIRTVLRTSRQESAVMLLTFLAALFADLEFAIYAGVLLSLIVYLTRTSRPLVLDVKPDPAPDSYHFTADSGLPDCPQLKMLRVNGSIFFGAVDHVRALPRGHRPFRSPARSTC